MNTRECPHGLDDPSWCSVCKEPQAKNFKPVGSLFHAKWNGNCPSCGEDIAVGDFIVNTTLGHVHAECSDRGVTDIDF
jgi:hypothetical protein